MFSSECMNEDLMAISWAVWKVFFEAYLTVIWTFLFTFANLCLNLKWTLFFCSLFGELNIKGPRQFIEKKNFGT